MCRFFVAFSTAFFVIKKAKRQILFVMKVIRKLLCLFLLGICLLALAFTGYYFIVTNGVSLSDEKLTLSENSVVLYDSENARVGALSADFSAPIVSGEIIPKKVKLAFISTEDKRFYSHSGFDFRRIVKAFISNAKAHSFKQGASTISQQLIKNTHLSQEKTLERKLREWKLTSQLERRYSKDEILEKYLNIIYFGHNCFGLRSAAEFYFGKSPEQLTLSDGAVLAGLVRSPNNYSPFKNTENCLKRKKSVLNGMLKNGYITQAEMDEALSVPLPTDPFIHKNNDGYMRFVFDELGALSEAHGFTLGGKIEIFTYLDQPLQRALENIASEYSLSDKTLTVLDSKTHAFKASVSTVGGIRRLPGSLLKPLLVYAPAMEEGLLSPATPILDEKINYAGYAPNNFDGKFHGYISARECIAKSLNVPAVKVLESLGVERSAEYLQKMGLPVEKDDLSLALALGGMKNGYTLNDLLSAYSVFPCGGNYTNGAYISCVKVNGQEVYRRKIEASRVFSEETAYLTTDMLKTAVKDGTAKKLRALPFEIAAKTGTVGTEKGNTDAYAVSYTTNDIVGVWLGNKDNSFIECTGGGTPCNLLLEINEWLQKYHGKIENFTIPKGVKRVALDKTSYYDTHTLLLADDIAPTEYKFTELFDDKLIPTQKSTIFSNPSIITPVLSYKNGKIAIAFAEERSPLYEYKIDRYDYATHNTVYQGGYIREFIDEELQENKRYIYTVTPIYKGRAGKEIILPTVSTKDGILPPSAEDREILERNWWEY